MKPGPVSLFRTALLRPMEIDAKLGAGLRPRLPALGHYEFGRGRDYVGSSFDQEWLSPRPSLLMATHMDYSALTEFNHPLLLTPQFYVGPAIGHNVAVAVEFRDYQNSWFSPSSFRDRLPYDHFEMSLESAQNFHGFRITPPYESMSFELYGRSLWKAEPRVGLLNKLISLTDDRPRTDGGLFTPPIVGKPRLLTENQMLSLFAGGTPRETFRFSTFQAPVFETASLFDPAGKPTFWNSAHRLLELGVEVGNPFGMKYQAIFDALTRQTAMRIPLTELGGIGTPNDLLFRDCRKGLWRTTERPWPTNSGSGFSPGRLGMGLGSNDLMERMHHTTMREPQMPVWHMPLLIEPERFGPKIIDPDKPIGPG